MVPIWVFVIVAVACLVFAAAASTSITFFLLRRWSNAHSSAYNSAEVGGSPPEKEESTLTNSHNTSSRTPEAAPEQPEVLHPILATQNNSKSDSDVEAAYSVETEEVWQQAGDNENDPCSGGTALCNTCTSSSSSHSVVSENCSFDDRAEARDDALAPHAPTPTSIMIGPVDSKSPSKRQRGSVSFIIP